MMRAMADDPAYARFKKICLALPETKVTITWGSPHMRVRDKIFTGWGLEDDGERWSFSVKLDKDKQAALVQSDPRFAIAAYTGKYGGTTMTVKKGEEDWGEIAALVEEGYRNVAPKGVAERLSGRGRGTGKGTGKKTVKR